MDAVPPSRNENHLHETTKRRGDENEGGRKKEEEFPRGEQAGVNSRRIFMGRLVEQGLRKLVNRLIALNDERRDFSGRQDGGEEGERFFCSSVARSSVSTVYTRSCG